MIILWWNCNSLQSIFRERKSEKNKPTIRASFYRCVVSIRANFHSHQDIIIKKLSAVYIDCVGNNLIDPNKGRLFGALDFRFLLCFTSVLFDFRFVREPIRCENRPEASGSWPGGNLRWFKIFWADLSRMGRVCSKFTCYYYGEKERRIYSDSSQRWGEGNGRDAASYG